MVEETFYLDYWGQDEFAKRRDDGESVSVGALNRTAPPFHKQIVEVDGFDDGGLDRLGEDGGLVPDLSRFTQIISEAGRKCGKGLVKGGCKHSDEVKIKVQNIKALERERDNEEDPVKRHSLSLTICKERRKVNRTRTDESCAAATEKLSLPMAFKKGNKRGRVYGLVDSSTGERYITPKEMSKHARVFYEGLFEDLDDFIPEWVWKTWTLKDARNLEQINGRMVRELMFEMTTGKTCASDGIVAEMLHQLDEDVCMSGVVAGLHHQRSRVQLGP